MEHSIAILEEAGKQIDQSAQSLSQDNTTQDSRKRKRTDDTADGGRARKDAPRNGKRRENRDMGRGDYYRQNIDKREKIANAGQRRREDSNKNGSYGVAFTQEEIDADQRRPKRKVAVMIGYTGTGYKGMQISTTEKTIEGDLFQAFIKAGAISKANADDPKKAGLVRCARTDKGVHAAGNMISLKLIVEDEDIVEKINSHLNKQIRVWGIVRTIGSFSCYQACDSRWYEYLIPSYAFLPPHPSSWLAKQIELIADEVGDREAYNARQEEVQGYWEEVEEQYIKPVIQQIDEDIRDEVVSALRGEDEANATKEGVAQAAEKQDTGVEEEKANDNNAQKQTKPSDEPDEISSESITIETSTDTTGEVILNEADLRTQRLRAATKMLRQAYMTAKRHYRIPEQRIERVREALAKYVGTHNYHNYTIQKSYNDSSAKRHIKSFVINGKPLLIGEGEDDQKTEWLSLKVHGQSFMMHQIRKMVSMVALLVRCGASLDRMDNSFTAARYSIPKAPGLGLMLERPVFDSYSNFLAPKHDREPLLFSKYEDKIEEFKREEIYAKMFSEEEEKCEFSRFFNHVDEFREPCFLFVSSKGIEACEGYGRREGYGEARPAPAEGTA